MNVSVLWSLTYNRFSQDGYDLNQDGNNQVTAVCGALYEMSAKCNKYMGNAAGSAVSTLVVGGVDLQAFCLSFQPR